MAQMRLKDLRYHLDNCHKILRDYESDRAAEIAGGAKDVDLASAERGGAKPAQDSAPQKTVAIHVGLPGLARLNR